MSIAKAILANDNIEGVPVVLPGCGDLSQYTYDDPQYAPHFTDPTSTNVMLSGNSRCKTGIWALEQTVMNAVSGDVAVPAVGAEANITYNALPFQAHKILGVSYSYNGATNGNGILTVEAGSGNIVFTKQIPSLPGGSEDSVYFPNGLRTTRSSAMIVRLTGVASISARVAVLGHRTE